MALMDAGAGFMDHPKGASLQRADRVNFDPRVRLEFRGTQLSSDGGLLVMREMDDALRLSDLASAALCDNRRGKNTIHRLDGLFRQSVFARLAGYEDVNDADRLALDPVMRQVVGGRAVDAQAASASQMGRFETETLALAENRAALADLNGQWIDRFHDRNGLKYIVLDMDSSVSPTHGDQEGSAWNGHFDCTCYHPNFLFNQFGMLERCAMATSTVRMAGGMSSILSSPGMPSATSCGSSGPMPPMQCQTCTNALKRRAISTLSGCPPITSCARRSRIG
jgi:hypothetical protein